MLVSLNCMEGRADAPAADPRYAWLPAVLPSSARSIRTSQAALAATIERAGGSVAGAAAEIEIDVPERIAGEAPVALALLEAEKPHGGPRPLRAVQRVVRSAALGRRAETVRRRLRRTGYPDVEIVRFEIDQRLRLPDAPTRAGRLVERWPLAGAVVARRGAREPTVLEAVVEAAGEELEGAAHVRDTGIVALTGASVFRLAVGASRPIRQQPRVLESLRRTRPAAPVATRIPWIEGEGAVGVSEWSRERRLAGEPPRPVEVTGEVLDQSLDFLAELFPLGRDAGTPASGDLRTAAAVVAEVAEPDRRDALLALGRELDSALADVPRGFAHGDFHGGNLLVGKDRLLGVIDWDAGGPGRLPLLDLFHLLVGVRMAQERSHLGPVVLDYLLPLARAGGDERIGALAARVGFAPDGELLERLALAYWLDFVARDLEKSADRRDRPDWLEPNVHRVARSLAR